MPHIAASGVKLHVEENRSRISDRVRARIRLRFSRMGKPRSAIFSARLPLRDLQCPRLSAERRPPKTSTCMAGNFAVDDIAAVMRGPRHRARPCCGLEHGRIRRAAVRTALSPTLASAIVAAGAGSGSPPAQREGLAAGNAGGRRRLSSRAGWRAMAEEMGHHPNPHPAQIQGSKRLAGFRRSTCASIRRAACPAPWRAYQTLRPSLHDFSRTIFEDDGPGPARGRRRGPAVAWKTNLMLKSAIPGAGLWICPQHGHAINLEEPAAFKRRSRCVFSARWSAAAGGGAYKEG